MPKPQINTDEPWPTARRLHQMGRHAEAEQLYEQILRRDSNHAGAIYYLGVIAIETGRFPRAEQLLRRAVAQWDDSAEIRDHLGVALHAQGKRAEAVESFRHAITLDPRRVAAHFNLAQTLRDLGRADEAMTSYRRTLELDPAHVQASRALVAMLMELGRMEELVEHYQSVLVRRPEDAEAVFNLGTALHHLGRSDEAIACFQRTLRLTPGKAAAVCNLGAVIQAKGQVDEAMAMFRRAIAMQPAFAEAHYNLGLALLLCGTFAEGWKEHEHRLALPDFFDPPRSFGVPKWDGSELRGRSILLHAEQGFGDTIQFFRYVPEIVRRGGRPLVVVRQELERLFQGENAHGARVISRLVIGADPIDVHLPLMSLPLMLGIHEPLATPMPYVCADGSTRSRWRDVLAEVTGSAHPGLKIGLVWRGSTTHKGDRHRSLSLATLAPLAREEATYVSLQLGAGTAEVASAPPNMRLIDVTSHIGDFADTAGLIAELDLVIAVDTAIAHLAGAMGKPVWVLLPFSPDWRWGRDGAGSAWYPTMRLFRQARPGDWGEPVAQMSAALSELSGKPPQQDGPARANVPQPSALHDSVGFAPRTAVPPVPPPAGVSGRPPVRAPAALSAESAEDHYNHGNALRTARHFEDAAAAYRRAISLRPDLAEAHNNLGTTLIDLQQYKEAISAFERAIQLKPDFASAYNNLGNALREMGQFDQALRAFDRAIAVKRDYVIGHCNRGILLRELGRLDDAMNAFRIALQLKPDYGAALDNLAAALKGQGRLHELIDLCRRLIALKPEYAQAHNHLADALWRLGELDAALEACGKALSAAPNLPDAHNTTGNILRDMGRLDEAVSCFRRAADLDPNAAGFLGNLAYTVHFHPDYNSASILEINRQWAARHEQPLIAKSLPHDNDRSPDRKLRIGYVSPDFRGHCASFFLMPLLAHHDPRQVDVICYSGVTQPDNVTANFKRLGHTWRESAHLTDARLADQIRADKIDILVDLTLHMAGNRLLVFARKPAPVQVTWLGYPSTTGCRSIDYRLTDPWLDPPGQGDEFYSEQSIRLPHSFWCYEPSILTADVNSLPAIRAGHLTFGCFNNFVKVTSATIALWARVLGRFPGSRLILLSPAGAHRDGISGTFERAGITRDRIDFVGRVPMDEYFRFYHRVDLCLDTSPYPGHTTTLDSLWMGVPVVTLAGQTTVGRGGVSILSNMGLTDWIAASPDQFEAIVAEKVTDLGRLAELRARLRARLQASPLMDARGFAAGVEAALREMWRAWCSS